MKEEVKYPDQLMVSKTVVRFTAEDKRLGLERSEVMYACEEAERQGAPFLVKTRTGFRGQILEMVFSS
jgi:hypothetical protein